MSAAGGVEVRVPACEPGVGRVIGAPDSADLIQGVRIAPAAVWADDRGYFLEVARLGCGLPAGFPPQTTQVSAALSYPGAIKVRSTSTGGRRTSGRGAGMLQVALVDLEAGVADLREEEHAVCGRVKLRPWQILIPPGVGHGYKVIGTGAGAAGLPRRTARTIRRTRGGLPTTTRASHYDSGAATQMKWLVTGGAGFIGSALQCALALREAGRRGW